MLENVKYNLGREYQFYATIPRNQRSKGSPNCNKKEIAYEKKNKYKNNPPDGKSKGLPGREKEEDNMLNTSTPNKPSKRGR